MGTNCKAMNSSLKQGFWFDLTTICITLIKFSSSKIYFWADVLPPRCASVNRLTFVKRIINTVQSLKCNIAFYKKPEMARKAMPRLQDKWEKANLNFGWWITVETDRNAWVPYYRPFGVGTRRRRDCHIFSKLQIVQKWLWYHQKERKNLFLNITYERQACWYCRNYRDR